ncbi:lyase family protein, partial [Faecalibacillus intestinalis]|uniref:lyase family protein n=1 Tax=Faecalibacillus intestinalis TaxID=1982626 RepID=UPI002E7A06FE
MDKQQFECFTLSPLDGRYAGIKDALGEYFSEYALVKYRVFVEIQWLKFLIENVESNVLSKFDKDNLGQIEAISKDFNYDSFKAIKDIEAVTRHDVKAVEYFIKGKFDEMGLSDYKEFIHFGLTSQDINNTSVPMMVKESLSDVFV